jgi:hypothetical protein
VLVVRRVQDPRVGGEPLGDDAVHPSAEIAETGCDPVADRRVRHGLQVLEAHLVIVAARASDIAARPAERPAPDAARAPALPIR